MDKKNRLYLLIFAFSMLSLITAAILRHFSIPWFDVEQHNPITLSNISSAIISFIFQFSQLYLITGIVTKESPKSLLFRTVIYSPLLILLYWIPKEYMPISSSIIIFVACIIWNFRFKTIMRYIATSCFVCIMQLMLIYIKMGSFSLTYSGYELIDSVILNIDQFIILTVLYYIVRKVGDMHDLYTIFSRKSR